ncbi:hypothetical protein LS482_00370 [Sinomicrobium kalidii]|uniref:hypothetical protein n=1 Tax=Sinomicrobium kalidii TaxID=2900738 RepID=UPI001E4F3CC9|nr:hypothetical protein [Sinomicrobium kalidii]UGU16338.1 hypothetical protein LS482_00370 [Sinomicrobium kalidii]
MRISLLETKQLEDRIFHRETDGEALVTDVKLYLNEDLRQKLTAQKQVYGYVKAYGRKKLKAEIASVHHRIFHEEQHRGFRNKIRRIFRRREK